MNFPDNPDWQSLPDVIASDAARPREPLRISKEDQDFIDSILGSITAESRGIFIAIHPAADPRAERLQYMLLNTNRPRAIALLARVLERLAEAEGVDRENEA